MIETIIHQKILWLRISPTIKIFFYLIPLFFIPFFLGGPQLLIGSIVNIFLIFLALNYKSYAMIIAMLMLPALATSLRWMIFWPFTMFLVYMMPAIWLGNFILIYTIQHIQKKRLGIFLGWFLKTLVIFIVAYVLVHLWILPTIFLKAMSVFQVITVMIAGVVVYGYMSLVKK